MKHILLLSVLLSMLAIGEDYTVSTAEDALGDTPREQWTFETKQYRKTFSTGLKKEPIAKSKYRKMVPTRDIVVPDKLDLRGKISQIEDQDGLGSCWAFSIIASLWDHWMLAGKDPGRLSQEYLTQCSRFCNGGYFTASDELIYPKGAPSWDEVPYTARCTPSCKKGTPKAWINDWYMVGDDNDGPSPLEIQLAMLAEGQAVGAEAIPASVTVNASFGGYSSGLYNNCNSAGTNHMTNLVGWSLNGCKPEADGFYPPSCKAEWIMRNSWGTDWGMDGYMRIQMTSSTSKRKCNRIGEEAMMYKLSDVTYTCGNGVKEPGEQCDDGNKVSGDGCSSTCQIEVDPVPPGPTPSPWPWYVWVLGSLAIAALVVVLLAIIF